MGRNINSTHNYLYCEFVTGMVMYFDLSVDPHQLRNVLHTLSDVEMNHMHEQVVELRNYSAESEWVGGVAKRRISQKEGKRKIDDKRKMRRKKGKRRLLPTAEEYKNQLSH